jgi:hypothetical protein
MIIFKAHAKAMLLMLAMALCAGQASATVRFVAPEGSDRTGDGSIGRPFGSIRHAHDLSHPGDIVYVRGGTYRLEAGMRLDGPGGTSAVPVEVLGYNGEVPILDGTAMPQTLGDREGGVALWIATSHTVFRGISIRSAAAGGIVVTGSGNILENISTSENGRASTWDGTGLRVKGAAANNRFIKVDSFLNRDWLGGGDDADGFAFHSTGAGNFFQECRAWRNSDDGFDFFNASNNSQQGVATVLSSQAWENGYAADGRAPLGDGRGFKMAGSRTLSKGNFTGVSGGHIFRGNRAWKNRMIGFDDNGAKVPLRIEGNVAFDNGRLDFYLAGSGAPSMVFGNRAGHVSVKDVLSVGNSWDAL